MIDSAEGQDNGPSLEGRLPPQKRIVPALTVPLLAGSAGAKDTGIVLSGTENLTDQGKALVEGRAADNVRTDT